MEIIPSKIHDGKKNTNNFTLENHMIAFHIGSKTSMAFVKPMSLYRYGTNA